MGQEVWGQPPPPSPNIGLKIHQLRVSCLVLKLCISTKLKFDLSNKRWIVIRLWIPEFDLFTITIYYVFPSQPIRNSHTCHCLIAPNSSFYPPPYIMEFRKNFLKKSLLSVNKPLIGGLLRRFDGLLDYFRLIIVLKYEKMFNYKIVFRHYCRQDLLLAGPDWRINNVGACPGIEIMVEAIFVSRFTQ